jgi:NADPH:quinone reductase-like Zn-dependent oxidoreductase
MKAAVIREHGPEAKVEIEEIAPPSPGAGQVLLDVQAAALNHLDVWVRTTDRFSLEKPHVLGSDAAGVISQLGHGVTGLSVGQEVVLDPGLSCGLCPACRRGENSLCTEYGIIGAHRGGTFAEQIVVPASNVYPKPAHLSFPQAAALVLSHLTAWRMLQTRAAVRSGQTLLIHGIGGGVALAGLQIALLCGARAIVTSSSDDKLARAAQIGAAAGINYQQQDVAGEVYKFTRGRGVDVILDSVGAATWPINFQAIAKGGCIVHCGVTGGVEAQANLSALYWNQVSVLGSTMGGARELHELLQAVEVGQIEPIVDKVFPLAQAADAVRRMEQGGQFGKIVLEVGA